MDDFQLAPFQFSAQPIEFFASAEESHSRVFAAIVARNTMLDPDVAKDILRDHGPDGDYQVVFDQIVQEYQQAYLFGTHPPEFFHRHALAYDSEHPTEGLREMVEFAAKNPPGKPEMFGGSNMPFQMPGLGFDAGQPARGPNARSVDKDKEKRKKKAAHKAKMRNRR